MGWDLGGGSRRGGGGAPRTKLPLVCAKRSFAQRGVRVFLCLRVRGGGNPRKPLSKPRVSDCEHALVIWQLPIYPAIIPIYALLSDTLGVLGFDISGGSPRPPYANTTNVLPQNCHGGTFDYQCVGIPANIVITYISF